MVVPLDVDIEMTQLICDAFRRRDRADSPMVEEEEGHGDNNEDVPDFAANEEVGGEEDLDEVFTDSEDVIEDCDGREELAGEGLGNGDIAWGFPPPESDARDGHVDDELLRRLSDADRIPLFAGATVSLLGTLLVLLTICKAHGVSNACVDELMKALSCQILPQPNTLPSSERLASRLLRTFGLGYNIIHACLRGCVLFRGVYAGLNRYTT